MSDLTRDEIRQACEFATPWRWMEWGDGSWGAMDEACGWIRFRSSISHHADKARDWTADAIALLEAWRCLTFENPYRQAVITMEDPPSVRLRELAFDDNGEPAGDWREWEHADIDFRTAAVRAVNRAAEQTPQDEETA